MSAHDPVMSSEVLAARYEEVRRHTVSLIQGLTEKEGEANIPLACESGTGKMG